MFLNNPSRIKREYANEDIGLVSVSPALASEQGLSLRLAHGMCTLQSLLTLPAFCSLPHFLAYISMGSKLTPSPQPVLLTKNLPILSSVLWFVFPVCVFSRQSCPTLCDSQGM